MTTKVPCKSVNDQLNLFLDFLHRGQMKFHTLWLNIEISGICDSWNLPEDGNFLLAEEWVRAIEGHTAQTGQRWGIYAPNTGYVADIHSRYR